MPLPRDGRVRSKRLSAASVSKTGCGRPLETAGRAMTVRYAAFTTSALPRAIAAGQPALAAEVTSDGSCIRSRRTGLMNQRTYDAQRYSPVPNDQQGQRQESQACSSSSATRSLALAAQRVASGVAWALGVAEVRRIRCFAGVETMADDAALIRHARRCALAISGPPSRGDALSRSYAPG
jgi:hypothetical protein